MAPTFPCKCSDAVTFEWQVRMLDSMIPKTSEQVTLLADVERHTRREGWKSGASVKSLLSVRVNAALRGTIQLPRPE